MTALDQTLRVTRRTALGALAGAATGFALFGPRGDKESPRGRVVLEYWEKWTGHEARAMQRIVDAFNASQDRIVVRYLVTAAVDQKALIAIAGGDPPDVVGLWGYNIPSFAQSKAILPLDDLAAGAGLSLDAYARGVVPIMRQDGKWWGVVNTCGTGALYYNRELFKAAGIEEPPRTIDELDACQERLTRRERDGRLVRAGFLQSEPGWWSWSWGYPFGARPYDEASGRAELDSAGNIAAYRWVRGYVERLGGDRAQQFQAGFGNYDSPLNAFLSGRVAMVLQGPWLANVINAYKPAMDYGVAPFPVVGSLYRPEEPVGFIDPDVLVIPRGVKRPEACMEFIAYTQRPEAVEALATAHCKNSTLARSSVDFLEKHPNRGVRVHDAIVKSPRSYIAPRTASWPQLKEEINASFQSIWTMRAAPESELVSLRGRAQVILDRAADQRRRREALRGASS
jgi:ABC-type glycerol-3-phosphate transport system substrate-binding protein